MIAAFSISGVPFFNGFISKSMVVASAGEAHYGLAMLFLNLASVGTFLSVGLKLPYFTWFSKEPHIEPKEPPKNMHIGMGLVALLCIGYGVFPSLLYRILPFPVHYEPYGTTHLIETIQLLTFTFVAFWLLRNFLKPKALQLIDFDWLYRKPVALYEKVFVGLPAAVFKQTDKAVGYIIRKSVDFGRNPAAVFSSRSADTLYTPDRYRPSLQSLVAIVLAAFIIISLIGVLFVL
jgi:multicomponent Na+:H+ antiporter subunit D